MIFKPDPERKRYVPLLLPPLMLLTAVVQRLPGSDSGLWELLFAATALCLLPWRHRRRGEKRDVLPLTLLAPAAGLGLGLLMAVIPGQGRSILAPTDWQGWAAAVLGLVLLPAVCEEALFRGCVTVHLMDAVEPAVCVALSALLFGLSHDRPAAIPGALCLGLLCTLLMMGTGRVLPCMLAHGGYNAAALLAALLPRSLWLGAAGLIPLGAIAHLIVTMTWKSDIRRTGSAEWLLLGLTLAILAIRLCI